MVKNKAKRGLANFSFAGQTCDVFVQVVRGGCAHAVAGVHGAAVAGVGAAAAAVDSRLGRRRYVYFPK